MKLNQLKKYCRAFWVCKASRHFPFKHWSSPVVVIAPEIFYLCNACFEIFLVLSPWEGNIVESKFVNADFFMSVCRDFCFSFMYVFSFSSCEFAFYFECRFSINVLQKQGERLQADVKGKHVQTTLAVVKCCFATNVALKCPRFQTSTPTYTNHTGYIFSRLDKRKT